MQYLLDTNICVFYLRGKFNLAKAIEARGYENCCVSEVTVAKLRYEAENSANPTKRHRLLDTFLQRIEIIPITDCIRTYAEVRVRLNRAGTPVHDNFDLMIAASAIYNKLTLVTDNLKDFINVAGIQIENWVER
jgi:tRNA(fMet)-specific endonuclease VapC